MKSKKRGLIIIILASFAILADIALFILEKSGYMVFHPQLGVKTLLDGGRRRTKNLYGVVKRTVPAGQVRQ